MARRIQTVLGEIDPDQAGIILPHEHLLWDLLAYGSVPGELHKRHMTGQPVCPENRVDVVYDPWSYPDTLIQEDLEIAIEEVIEFKKVGGKTVCDVSNWQIGRDPQALYELSVRTGLNIVMGTGCYIEGFWSEEDKSQSEEAIRDRILQEFENGIGFLKIKPGIIGEVGLDSVNSENEMRSLRASAAAQKEIGCALSVHRPFFTESGEKAKDDHIVLDVIEGQGADIAKVAVGHLDLITDDPDHIDSIAKRGAYIEFDLWGHMLMPFRRLQSSYIPCDMEKAAAIKEQIERGNLRRILISHDICMKHCLKRWGGHGYSHIPKNIVGLLSSFGEIDERDIQTILVENPKEYLTW